MYGKIRVGRLDRRGEMFIGRTGARNINTRNKFLTRRQYYAGSPSLSIVCISIAIKFNDIVGIGTLPIYNLTTTVNEFGGEQKIVKSIFSSHSVHVHRIHLIII